MATTKKRGNVAVFYHRDSSGKHEQTPAKYVEWAQKEIVELKLQFNGSPSAITSMIQTGQAVLGDVFLDFNVTGNLLERPALNALLQRVVNDQNVSHLFIPLRERLARPDDPEDGIKLENAFRRAGVTVHFQDLVLKPLAVGERVDIGELVRALVDYHQAGKFRQDLAAKMINAQRSLGEQGFSTGGRPPFFLRRWLIDPQGVAVRELSEGEVVRQRGHHVAWLPSSPASLELALRIVELLEQMKAATQVAALLTREGVPSPDAGRSRTDHGIRHPVSGDWHATTIVNTVRSLYLIGEKVYGRRSMGDQKRYSPDGPRDLTEDDLRNDKKPKVIANPQNDWTIAPARYQPLVDPERIKRILDGLDERGKSQRGKPRSPDPTNNPLGCRVFDMSCGWPMYRVPYPQKGEPTFRYKCGEYMQSHGAKCAHNHVDGPSATLFVLQAIKQRLISPELRQRIEERLNQLATADASHDGTRNAAAEKEVGLSQVRADVALVQRNMARAKSDQQYAAISAEFEQLKQREGQLVAELAKLSKETRPATTPEQEVAAALSLLDRLTALAEHADDFSAAKQLFDTVDAKLFLRFQSAKWGKRDVQKITSGVLTFGASPPPIKLYEGRTGRVAVQSSTTTEHAAIGGKSVVVTEEEEDSLGNVSRGDRI